MTGILCIEAPMHRVPDEPAQAAQPPDTIAVLRAAAEKLPPIDEPAFGAAFDRFGEASVVLLGEASHGTSEFYAEPRPTLPRALWT